MKKLFGTDGIRGEANVELSSQIAYLTGLYSAYVLAEDQKKRTVVIGKDTRKSCDMIESALCAGLLSVGLDVVLLGVVPTPAIPHLIREYEAELGIMISASHNPAEFNGIKLFNKKGLKLSDEIEAKIEALIKEDDRSKLRLSSLNVGSLRYEPEAHRKYQDILLKHADFDLQGMKIALDCANGSNYKIAPEILRSLGAELFVIGDAPDGLNINKDCGSTHLGRLQDLTKEKQAHIGIAFDGDADRILAVDENGDLIDGDRIILAIAKDLKRKELLKNNTVAVTVMSNMGLEIALRNEEIDLVRTKVGDRYVLESMLHHDYSLGGEQSGHIIIKDLNTTGDGLATCLNLLGVLKNGRGKASDITNGMQSLPQVLLNVKVPNTIKYGIEELEEVRAAVLDVEEKLHQKGRVLLRASGTEPMLRVMVEGENREEIEKHAKDLAKLIETLSEEGK